MSEQTHKLVPSTFPEITWRAVLAGEFGDDRAAWISQDLLHDSHRGSCRGGIVGASAGLGGQRQILRRRIIGRQVSTFISRRGGYR